MAEGEDEKKDADKSQPQGLLPLYGPGTCVTHVPGPYSPCICDLSFSLLLLFRHIQRHFKHQPRSIHQNA